MIYVIASSLNGLDLRETPPMVEKHHRHSEVQTTARYAHLARNTVKSAEQRVAASFSSDPKHPPPRGEHSPPRDLCLHDLRREKASSLRPTHPIAPDRRRHTRKQLRSR